MNGKQLKLEFFERISSELTGMEKEREKILQKIRQWLIETRKVFNLINEEKTEEANLILHKIYEEVRKFKEKVKNFSKYKIYFHPLYRELAEAFCFLGIIKSGEVINPYLLDFPIISFLHGLTESIGELKRFTLNQVIKGEINKAKKTFNYMESIFNAISLLTEFPDSLTLNLRRKIDVARRNVEETRNIIAYATLHQMRE